MADVIEGEIAWHVALAEGDNADEHAYEVGGPWRLPDRAAAVALCMHPRRTGAWGEGKARCATCERLSRGLTVVDSLAVRW